MPVIFSTLGRAALSLGRAALTYGKGLLSRGATAAAETVGDLTTAQIKKAAQIKEARRSKMLEWAQNLLSPRGHDTNQEQTLAQKEAAAVNHMSIWVVIGLVLFMILFFFTNLGANAPIPTTSP